MSSELGWAELRAGRWESARAAFAAADETAESLEGLSWAAWWLDEADAVFDARERAYRAYQETGDAAGAARMATWLAADELDFHGAVAVASGWLQRASRLLEPLEAGPDHGWLAFHEGYVAHASGDAERARKLAVDAADIGRRFAVPDLEMLGLALEGGALVAQADVEAGMRCLDEATATALAGEATIPISSAWTCCFLVSACTAVRDFDRAFEWCDRIAEFAERYGSRYMLGFCRAEYGVVHLWRGRWAEAEELLESSIEDFARSRPAYAAGPMVQLAELRRRQGRPGEAARLLEVRGRPRARSSAGRGSSSTPATHRPLSSCSKECAAGRPVRARSPSSRCSSSRRSPSTTSIVPLPRLSTCVARRADRDRPAARGADLAEGMLAASRGEHEHARPLLEDAVVALESSGAPFEAAHARAELAATLAALGRNGRADRDKPRPHERFTRSEPYRRLVKTR